MNIDNIIEMAELEKDCVGKCFLRTAAPRRKCKNSSSHMQLKTPSQRKMEWQPTKRIRDETSLYCDHRCCRSHVGWIVFCICLLMDAALCKKCLPCHFNYINNIYVTANDVTKGLIDLCYVRTVQQFWVQSLPDPGKWKYNCSLWTGSGTKLMWISIKNLAIV